MNEAIGLKEPSLTLVNTSRYQRMDVDTNPRGILAV